MKYNEKINEDLIKIIEQIDENIIEGNDGALALFKKHITEVSNLGKFSIISWNYDWRKSVYNFGTKFKENNPIDFLNILTSSKIGLIKDQQEVLDFYYSEIDANSLPEETCTLRMESLVQKYPYNPEFRHTFGHFYKNNKEYEQANVQYKFALSKDKGNSTFMESLFESYYAYLETFIDNSDYDKGIEICEYLFDEEIFKDEFIYHNQIVAFNERFKDYKLLNKKIEDAEVKIKEIILKETNKGQLKIVEILGFFTAIIAFVFSTLSVGKNFDFKEAIIFNITLGITLLNFALIISLLFSNDKVKLNDYRIVLLVLLVLILILMTGSIWWL